MRDVEEKKGKLINLKDELESLNRRELNIFLFDFIKEPCAYVSGRFSDAISFEEIKKCASNYSSGIVEKQELLNHIDRLLQLIVSIDDAYDREILYSIASAFLAFIDRAHAFDAVLHDIDAIVLDVGFEESLAVIPLRIDHHHSTIAKARNQYSSEEYSSAKEGSVILNSTLL